MTRVHPVSVLMGRPCTSLVVPPTRLILDMLRYGNPSVAMPLGVKLPSVTSLATPSPPLLIPQCAGMVCGSTSSAISLVEKVDWAFGGVVVAAMALAEWEASGGPGRLQAMRACL